MSKIKNDELVRGSLILFIMINIFNLGGYLLHLLVARKLGPADYGIFAALMSFTLIYGIPSEAIQTIMSRVTSKFNIGKNYSMIKKSLEVNTKAAIKIAIGVFTIATIISLIIKNAVKINFSSLLITNIVIFFLFLTPITRGILQGRKKFFQLGLTFVIEAALKLLLAYVLIIIGLEVYGAIGGVVLAVIIVFLISWLMIKEVRKAKDVRRKLPVDIINKENLGIWFSTSAIFLFFSADIIIAKALFDPIIAGKYAVLSMIGKMIFFGTFSIAKAMLPISSEKHDNKESSRSILIKSFILISAICSVSTIIVALFPKLIVIILFGQAYIDVYTGLIYSAIAFSVLSLTYLFLTYAIAKKRLKTKWSVGFLTLFMFEGVLLSYLAKDINSFFIILIIVHLLTLGLSYYVAIKNN